MRHEPIGTSLNSESASSSSIYGKELPLRCPSTAPAASPLKSLWRSRRSRPVTLPWVFPYGKGIGRPLPDDRKPPPSSLTDMKSRRAAWPYAAPVARAAQRSADKPRLRKATHQSGAEVDRRSHWSQRLPFPISHTVSQQQVPPQRGVLAILAESVQRVRWV